MVGSVSRAVAGCVSMRMREGMLLRLQTVAKKVLAPYNDTWPPYDGGRPRTRTIHSADGAFKCVECLCYVYYEVLRFYQIDGAVTSGQWIINTAIDAGTQLHKSNVSAFQLHETELLMLFLEDEFIYSFTLTLASLQLATPLGREIRARIPRDRLRARRARRAVNAEVCLNAIAASLRIPKDAIESFAQVPRQEVSRRLRRARQR